MSGFLPFRDVGSGLVSGPVLSRTITSVVVVVVVVVVVSCTGAGAAGCRHAGSSFPSQADEEPAHAAIGRRAARGLAEQETGAIIVGQAVDANARLRITDFLGA
jgi:hypothetical protein